MLKPKHAVSEGLMTLAEDKRPEANQLIEFRPYALQRHTPSEYKVDVSLSTLAENRFVAEYISDAMPNSHSGEAVNSEELLILYCDKH
jgi:hypothetical protein